MSQEVMCSRHDWRLCESTFAPTCAFLCPGVHKTQHRGLIPCLLEAWLHRTPLMQTDRGLPLLCCCRETPELKALTKRQHRLDVSPLSATPSAGAGAVRPESMPARRLISSINSGAVVALRHFWWV